MVLELQFKDRLPFFQALIMSLLNRDGMLNYNLDPGSEQGFNL
jgi:hypothetical protein